jgi:hypothetical protein
MTIPKEVQERIDFLNKYTENKELNRFCIIHMYPKEIAYPNGYYDAKFADIVGFYYDNDLKIREKRHLRQCDALSFDENVHIEEIRIFADGSTLIKFKHPVTVTGFYANMIISAL